MGLIIFIVFCIVAVYVFIFVRGIVYIVKCHKNKKMKEPYYDNYMDDLALMAMEDRIDDLMDEQYDRGWRAAKLEDSMFPAPDPYEMNPEDLIYLKEDGDIFEDF